MINVSSRKKHKGTIEIISLFRFKTQLFTKNELLVCCIFYHQNWGRTTFGEIPTPERFL